MTRVTPFRLSLPSGRALHGRVHGASRPGRRPTVVICHGFKGFMEWGFFPYLADLLAERGLTTVRFNFTGSGMRPGDDRVTDLEAFRTATFSRDLEELLALLEALGDSVAEGAVDRGRMALFGHSRGGGTALLAAADRRWADRLAALVTWAAVSSFDRTGEQERSAWLRQGWAPVVNARTGQQLQVDRLVLDDLRANRDRLDLLAAAARRRSPWLIVHGQQDESVPMHEGSELAAAAQAPSRLLMVEGASHTFGAVHPFAGPTPQLIAALNATQTWFRRHLA